MLEQFRTILRELDRSVYEGERHEKNMRSIGYVAMFIVVVNGITGSLNLINGYSGAAIDSAMFLLAGLAITYFTHIKQSRRGAVITAFISVVIIFTYEIVSVSHVLVLFFTPLRQVINAQYSEIIVQRFPVLYLANVVLTTFIMAQYHLTTLRQIDYAQQLLESKEAADRANTAKSDFLANMSHEIRTPINAVLSMNEMILRESAQARRLPDADAQGVRAAFESIRAHAIDAQSADNNLLSLINTNQAVDADSAQMAELYDEVVSAIQFLVPVPVADETDEILEFLPE